MSEKGESEIRAEVERLLKSIGYKSKSVPITKEFMAKPTFYGK